jgi:hypothetical protein
MSEPMQMVGEMTGTLAKGSLDVVIKKRPFRLASINICLPIRSAGGGPAARHIILRKSLPHFLATTRRNGRRIMASEDKLQSNPVQLSDHSFLDPSHLHQGRYNRSTLREPEFTTNQRRNRNQSGTQHRDTATAGVLNLSPYSCPALAFRSPRGKLPPSKLHRARSSRREASVPTLQSHLRDDLARSVLPSIANTD